MPRLYFFFFYLTQISFLRKGDWWSKGDLSTQNMEKTTFAMQGHLLEEDRGEAERVWGLTSLDENFCSATYISD